MTGKRILVFGDNEASVQVLNYAANLQFEVKAKHISGETNCLPDYLSRWEIDKKLNTGLYSKIV